MKEMREAEKKKKPLKNNILLHQPPVAGWAKVPPKDSSPNKKRRSDSNRLG
jgi:hypothetical protein